MPPRKDSHPSHYSSRSARLPWLRRSRLKTFALAGLGIVALLFILSKILGGGPEGVPSGTPPVVIVTVLQSTGYSQTYLEGVKLNREAYAKKHGKMNL